jgi:hypothetical protein
LSTHSRPILGVRDEDVKVVLRAGDTEYELAHRYADAIMAVSRETGPLVDVLELSVGVDIVD